MRRYAELHVGDGTGVAVRATDQQDRAVWKERRGVGMARDAQRPGRCFLLGPWVEDDRGVEGLSVYLEGPRCVAFFVSAGEENPAVGERSLRRLLRVALRAREVKPSFGYVGRVAPRIGLGIPD